MLAEIKDFYRRLLQPQDELQRAPSDKNLKLAAVALMIEVMRIDDNRSKQEVDAIIQATMNKFDIDRHEAQELMELAASELRDATDCHQFTSLINQGYETSHKLVLLEIMWQVAYADGQLDMYEEHVIRKVADLLYIPHREFIRLKEKAKLSSASVE